MDNSMQSACTDKAFEEQQPVEMTNSVPGYSDDPTFDWHDFKDFLLNEENFEIILNALQKNTDAQSVVNQQQYFFDPTNGVSEASFGGQYSTPPVTYLYQPANGAPEPSIFGQYTALPVTYSNHAAPISTEGSGAAAPTSSTASASMETINNSGKNREPPAGPQVYIKKPPNGLMLFLKDQRPLVEPEVKRTGSTAILTYLGAMWKSLPSQQKEKDYKKADVKKKYSNHAAPISTEGSDPASPTSATASAPQGTVNKSRKHGASPAGPQVYIKKPPNAFMLFLKEQRPLVRPELKTTGSKAVLTHLGTMWKSLPNHQKEKYYKEAEKQRLLHKEQNPGWSTKDNYGKKLTKAGKRRLVKNSGT